MVRSIRRPTRKKASTGLQTTVSPVFSCAIFPLLAPRSTNSRIPFAPWNVAVQPRADERQPQHSRVAPVADAYPLQPRSQSGLTPVDDLKGRPHSSRFVADQQASKATDIRGVRREAKGLLFSRRHETGSGRIGEARAGERRNLRVGPAHDRAGVRIGGSRIIVAV